MFDFIIENRIKEEDGTDKVYIGSFTTFKRPVADSHYINEQKLFCIENYGNESTVYKKGGRSIEDGLFDKSVNNNR